MASQKPLDGRTAFVTGGSSGMGAMTARLLAEDGAAVLIMGRSEEALVKTRGAILADLPDTRIKIHPGDAHEEDAVRAGLAKAHAIAGRLDIVVPVVGGGDFGPILLLDLKQVRYEFEHNFVSAFLAIRHGVPLMGKGGSIVCISTAAVLQPFFGLASYASTKAALERFVRAAALEFGPAGIRVNSVRPGMTRSRGTEGMYESEELVALYAAETPLRRCGEPEDIARVVRFLAGPESGWVTGQNISADGGQDQGKIPDMLDEIYGAEEMAKVRAGKEP